MALSMVDGVGEDIYLAGVGMVRTYGSLSVLICVSDAGFDCLNFRTASSANTSFLSTHWFSESGYPFHLTRYCSLRPLPNFRESRIFSTSYSSALLTKSGGGRE